MQFSLQVSATRRSGFLGVVAAARWRPVARRQFEPGKLERRRDDAADETPVAERNARLPRTCRDHHLRPLAGRQVAAEPVRLDRAAGGAGPDGHGQRRAGVVAPDLGRVVPVPVTALAGSKQEIDARHAAAAAVRRHVREDLAVVASLGVRREAEDSNHVVARHVRRRHSDHLYVSDLHL